MSHLSEFPRKLISWKSVCCLSKAGNEILVITKEHEHGDKKSYIKDFQYNPTPEEAMLTTSYKSVYLIIRPLRIVAPISMIKEILQISKAG